MTKLANVVWRKSTRSNNSNNCVEVAILANGGTAVRDSKQHGAGPVLEVTSSEWMAFIAGVIAGEFNNHRPDLRMRLGQWFLRRSCRQRRAWLARTRGPVLTPPDA